MQKQLKFLIFRNDRINMNRLPDEWRNRAIRDDIAKVHPMFFV